VVNHERRQTNYGTLPALRLTGYGSEKYFHKRAFASLGALEDQMVVGLHSLETDHQRVKSIAGLEYINNSIYNAKIESSPIRDRDGPLQQKWDQFPVILSK
jgi:hypothetical protein